MLDRPLPHRQNPPAPSVLVAALLARDHWIGASTYDPDYNRFRPGREGVVDTTQRLHEYRERVAWGWYPDIATAHRMDLAAWATRKAAQRQRQDTEWWHQQWKRRQRRFQFNRAVVFAWPRRCTYCGARAICADHVVPRLQGGTDFYGNLTPACIPCNSSKGDRTPQEWQAWRAEKGLCWPPAGAIWTGVAA